MNAPKRQLGPTNLKNNSQKLATSWKIKKNFDKIRFFSLFKQQNRTNKNKKQLEEAAR